MMLGKLDIHIKMNETEHLSYTLQQKWTQNILYIIPETVKLLEENTGEKLHDICLEVAKVAMIWWMTPKE